MRAALFLLGLASASVVQVTPVQKVIQLLNGSLEKGKSEKHEEQVQFAKFNQFCQDTTVEKQTAIEKANQEIDSLKASIEKHDSEADRLAEEISELQKDIDTYQGDKKAATEVRKIEREDYTALHKDYSESIDALTRAIAVLKKQNFDRKQTKAVLAQVAAVPMILKDGALKAFIQNTDVGLDVVAPEANAYEFQSGGVIEMLEKLLDKFSDERYAAEKDEANSKHAHQMLVQDLDAQIKTATESSEAKTAEKSSNMQSAANNRGELADTTTTRDDDQAYLDDLKSTCRMKSGDFEARQQLRSEEIEAIEKAIEILSSGDVSGNAEKHLPQLIQRAFVQISLSTSSPVQARVSQFLEKKAARLHSTVLSALALRAADDPFNKVKKMIQDLIVRLQQEANQEAEHKGWCDTELSTNKQTREEKTSSVENLHATIDSLKATIAKLSEDVSTLNKQVSEIDAAVQEATSQRADEKKTNEETIADAQAAQTALAQAMQVLKDFYAKAGQATSLLQKQQPEAPEIFDAAYKGMQSENGGIMGMLEVIESDFARLETETKAAESTAQHQHDKFLSDSAVDKAQKNKDIEHKTNKKISKTNDLTTSNEDLDSTQKELDAANDYFDKLKPSCVDSGVSYEDRVARRKEEVESLQEALRILNGEEIA